jgi:hypothetical protein
MGKKAYVQARAGTTFEKIFTKFEFRGIDGDKPNQKM